jgi:hypothetical protein
MAERSRLAVLGAGHLGPVIARLAIKAGYHELEDRARPAGAPERGAVGIAGDDPAAVAATAALADRIGYDPVRLGSLRAGRVLQPGGPVFGVVLTRPEFQRATGEAAVDEASRDEAARGEAAGEGLRSLS